MLINNCKPEGKLYLVIFGLLLLLVSPIHAQYNDLLFESFNKSNGLSSNNVNCIIEDAEGFIWIGTDNGLNRFDGYNYTWYFNSPEDTNSLIHNHVLSLFLASDSTLWVGTQYGICRFQNEYNSFVQIHKGYFHGFTRGFYEDQNVVHTVIDRGEIFSIENDRLILKYNANIYANCYLRGSDNIHWFGEENGFCKYDTQKDTVIHFRLTDSEYDGKSAVFAIEEYNDKLWIGTRGYGVFIFDINTNRIIHHDESLDFIKSIENDNHGCIFIGNTKELKIYNQDYKCIGSYQPFKKDNQQEIDNSVDAIYKDNQGNLWLGVKFRGIQMAYPRKGFHSLQEAVVSKTTQEGTVTSVLAINDHEIWLGSYNNGIIKVNLQTGKSDFMPCIDDDAAGLQCGSVYELYRDKANDIWIGSYFGGLQKYIPQTNSVVHYSYKYIDNNSNDWNDIRSICEDHDGNYWIAPHGNGLIKWNKKTGEVVKSRDDTEDSLRLINNWVFHVLCDSRNYVWCGTSYGLSVTRDNGKTLEVYLQLSNDSTELLSNEVFTVFEDSKNQIWIGTRKGLCKYREGTNDFIQYTMKDGLIDNFICAIQEDKRGQLWISTKGGLSCFNPHSQSFKNYDISDDIPSNEFMENASAITPSGYLVFGSVNGGVWFHPDSITENKLPPQVRLTDFKVYNQSVPINPNDSKAILNKHIQYCDRLTIDHNQKMITFSFVALNFIHHEQNKYAYKLENFDNEWIYTDGKQEATYTSLPPGKYIFRVIAANNDGYWNNDGVSIPVTVLPPVWQTWWFRIVGALLIISLVFFIYYLRIKRVQNTNRTLEKLVDERTRELQSMNMKLKELNVTKDKFFSIISHDLLNPLNIINGFSDLYLKSYPEISEEKKLKYIDSIHSTALKTLSLLDGLLTWSRSQSGVLQFNPEKYDLHDIIRDNLKFFAQLSDNKNIKLQSVLNDKPDYVVADENMVKTILRNMLSNAIKFTPEGGNVTVRCGPYSNPGFILIEVSDSGVGIEPQVIESLGRIDSNVTTRGTDGETGTGLGLILCQEFVQKNGGTMWIESEVGKGSSFFFTLPVSNGNLNQQD
ncbi:MAG: hypothetical protein JXB49_08180 [Bacteroidales bacterium]|nr:hypothetical protein [Bacteroidales bacterium]